MKWLISAATLLLLLQIVRSDNFAIDDVTSPNELTLPSKCEDVLDQTKCTKLRDMAKLLGELPSKVEEAIKKFVEDGKTKVIDAYDYTRKYLVDKANNFTCTDALPQEMCTKLETIARYLKISLPILTVVLKEAIYVGATLAKALFKVTIAMLAQLTGIHDCEDVLAPDVCTKLIAFTTKAHLKVTEVIEAIKDAVADGAWGDVEIYKNALANLKAKITCDNMIGIKHCDRLRTIAKLLGETASDVEAAIKNFVEKADDKITDIYDFVTKELLEKAKNLSCTDVIVQPICTKLENFANKVHVKITEVIESIKQAIASGAWKDVEIYKKAIANLTAKITCDNMIGKTQCDRLRTIANLLGETASEVEAALKKFVEQGMSKAAEAYDFITEVLIVKAKNFTCTDVLAPQMCDRIIKIAKLFKMEVAKVHVALKEAIAKGAVKAEEMYKLAVAWLRDNVLSTTCKDLIDANVCIKLEAYAKKVQVKMSEVMEAVKEAIADGYAGGVEIYRNAITYLKNKISCSKVLGQAMCDKIQYYASKFRVSLQKVETMIRELISSGVTKIKELYKKVIKFIWEKMWGKDAKTEYDFANRRDELGELIAIMANLNTLLRDVPTTTNEMMEAWGEKMKVMHANAETDLIQKLIESDAPMDPRAVFLGMVNDVGSSIVSVSATLTQLVDDAQDGMSTINKDSKKMRLNNNNIYDYSEIDTITNDVFEEIRKDVESVKGIAFQKFHEE